MLTWPNLIRAFHSSSFLVCGRGPSLAYYPKYRPLYNFCIAGNHTPAPCEPQFRFACDKAMDFIRKKRATPITHGQQLIMFACDPFWGHLLKHSLFVQVKFEAYQLTSLSQLATRLPITRNVAVGCTYLALAMGAKKVGLLGVDLDHPDYANALPSIIADFDNLLTLCKREGRQLVNHSSESLLKNIPYQPHG